MQYVTSDGQGGFTTSYNDASGNPIGPRAESNWLYDVPWGLYNLLKYINNK
jgi:beta-glucosidase